MPSPNYLAYQVNPGQAMNNSLSTLRTLTLDKQRNDQVKRQNALAQANFAMGKQRNALAQQKFQHSQELAKVKQDADFVSMLMGAKSQEQFDAINNSWSGDPKDKPRLGWFGKDKVAIETPSGTFSGNSIAVSKVLGVMGKTPEAAMDSKFWQQVAKMEVSFEAKEQKDSRTTKQKNLEYFQKNPEARKVEEELRAMGATQVNVGSITKKIATTQRAKDRASLKGPNLKSKTLQEVMRVAGDNWEVLTPTEKNNQLRKAMDDKILTGYPKAQFGVDDDTKIYGWYDLTDPDKPKIIQRWAE